MRRLISLLACFLLIVSSACADPAPYLLAARDKADQVEQKYGIRILIGDEGLVGNVNSHDVDPVTAGSSPLDQMQAGAVTIQAVKMLDHALAAYPSWLLDWFSGRLGFSLVGAILLPDYSVYAGGLTHYTEDSRVLVYLDVYSLQEEYIHHEIWHVIELFSGETFDDWSDLNPEGFRYTCQYDDYSGFDSDWFYRSYGVVNPLEDRATIFEAIFKESDDWWDVHPQLKQKRDVMIVLLQAYHG